MRTVLVVCIEDNINFSLGSDVGLIGEIIELGKYVGDLTYELKVKGLKLNEIIYKYNLQDKIHAIINVENTYVITAYDW